MTEDVVCPCGVGGRMAVYIPGTEALTFEGIVVTRAIPTLGWCCFEHARRDGWPWLESERPRRRSGSA